MGWRKTGTFSAPTEILVLTCDVCERDIGHEDRRRSSTHYEVKILPHIGTLGDQDRTVYTCSVECLRAFASREPEPGQMLHRTDRTPD
jgi:hypothetical protein